MQTNFPCQLQRRFEEAIATGEYATGDILISSDLARRFEVTTNDMLLVLLAAHRKGLVVRRDDVFEVLGLATSDLDSVFMHTAKSGLKPTSEVRAVKVEPARPAVAEKLDLEVGAPIYRFERTRYVNEEALANQINYMPFEVCPGLEYDDVSRFSFQKLLGEKYLTVFTEVKEYFDIVPATEQDVEILNLPPGSSILLVQRIALSPTGCPVVWANIRIRPDRYQYVAELWPEAAELLTKKA